MKNKITLMLINIIKFSSILLKVVRLSLKKVIKHLEFIWEVAPPIGRAT